MILKGKKGELKFTLQPCVSVTQEDNTLVVSVKNQDVKEERALWGLTRALVANMVTGVTEGFKKSLEIQGVGYKFEVNSPSKITLAVGFSHKIVLDAPAGVIISADEKEKNIIKNQFPLYIGHEKLVPKRGDFYVLGHEQDARVLIR